MIDGISGAIIKFQRAIKHVEDLEAAVFEFCRADAPPFIVHEEFNSQTGEVIFTARDVKAIPTSFGVIAGDAIHNMKSGLEILWRWCIDPANKRLKCPFPFLQNADALKARFQGREKGAVKKAVNCLLAINPCEDWREILWRLSIADDSDKHRVLTPVIAANRVMVAQTNDMEVPTISSWSRNSPRTIEEGAILFCAQASEYLKLKVDMKPEFPAYVAFGDVYGFDGERIIAIGDEISVLMNQWLWIVSAIATAFREAGLFTSHEKLPRNLFS